MVHIASHFVTTGSIGTTVTVVLSTPNLGMLVVSAVTVLVVEAAGAEMNGVTNFAGGDDSMILVADFASVGCIALPGHSVKQVAVVVMTAAGGSLGGAVMKGRSLLEHSVEQLVGAKIVLAISAVAVLVVAVAAARRLLGLAAATVVVAVTVELVTRTVAVVVAAAEKQLGDAMTEVRPLLKHSVEHLIGTSAVVEEVVDAVAWELKTAAARVTGSRGGCCSRNTNGRSSRSGD